MSKYDYRIVRAGGHYNVYIDGKFYCTADTVVEAAEEVDKYFEGDE